MHQEEVDSIEVELMGRERLEKIAEEQAAAEANGWSDLVRMQEALASTETKIDRLKQGLYFPPVKGYR